MRTLRKTKISVKFAVEKTLKKHLSKWSAVESAAKLSELYISATVAAYVTVSFQTDSLHVLGPYDALKISAVRSPIGRHTWCASSRHIHRRFASSVQKDATGGASTFGTVTYK